MGTIKSDMTHFKQIEADLSKKYNLEWLLVDDGLLDALAHFIKNPPKSTVIEGGTHDEPICFTYGDFDIGYPVWKKFGRYINRQILCCDPYDFTAIRDFFKNPDNAKEDMAWTRERNKKLNAIYYHKYDYSPALQQKIQTVLSQIRAELIEYRDAEKNYTNRKKTERTKARQEFEVTILSRSTRAGGEDGPDPYAKVRIIDPQRKESAIFICRNIFDFGYVINPEGGGLASNVENMIQGNPLTFNTDDKKREYRTAHPTSTGWGWSRDFLDSPDWVEMTDFEIRAIKYLNRFSPISTDIRM